MKTSTLCNALIALLFVPAVALPQTVNLTGKTVSTITAHVANRDVLTVTDDKGDGSTRDSKCSSSVAGRYPMKHRRG
ncbi:MAG: hypothetical protein V4796_19210 [Burkholderia cenocepacia]